MSRVVNAASRVAVLNGLDVASVPLEGDGSRDAGNPLQDRAHLAREVVHRVFDEGRDQGVGVDFAGKLHGAAENDVGRLVHGLLLPSIEVSADLNAHGFAVAEAHGETLHLLQRERHVVVVLKPHAPLAHPGIAAPAPGLPRANLDDSEKVAKLLLDLEVHGPLHVLLRAERHGRQWRHPVRAEAHPHIRHLHVMVVEDAYEHADVHLVDELHLSAERRQAGQLIRAPEVEQLLDLEARGPHGLNVGLG
mmetsp:Transcript_92691/g.239348  ORF Transcript_92691/g.239348 Transcript_92691/m.239348 type:complete len:249 (-) Transcript_92691:1337-2083(-)